MSEETKEPNPVFPESLTRPSTNRVAEPQSAASSLTPSVEQGGASADPGQPGTPAATPATTTEKPAETPKPSTPLSEAPAKPAAPAAKPAAPAAKPSPRTEGPKPLPWESELVVNLRSQYGSGIKEASTYVGQKYVVVDSAICYEVLRRMREDEQFDYCVDITAVHYPKREQPFDVVYILYSFHDNERVRVKTLITDGERLRSAVSIWPTANWLEREVFDMFGIEFDGHPDLKRILLPDGWKGHPLRKDYPILQQDKDWVQINLGIESGQ